AIQAAVDQVAAARAELAQGHPAAARAQLVPAADAAGNAPALQAQIASLSGEIDRVISTAVSDWRTAEGDINAHRLYAAMDRLAKIARVASDVPGPGDESAADQLAELATIKASLQADIAAARKLPDEEKEATLGRILSVASDCSEANDMLAALPLAPPGNLLAEAGADSIALRWEPSRSAGQVTYKITRLIATGGHDVDRRVLGTTSATEFDDAGAPGGAMVTHEVASISGKRTSEAATAGPTLMARDVTSLTARPDASGITLSWNLPIVAGNVVVEREVDPRSGLNLPLRRARAEDQSWRDANPETGVDFSYHVYAEYRDADGKLVRTPGAMVRARVAPRPRPVSELWANTHGGHTTVGWVTPPSGEVRIYAGSAPLADPDSEVDLGDLARRGRYIGAGQRRVVDENPGHGIVTYTSVTVDGGQAVAGPSVAHLPVAQPANATVSDTGSELVLTFTLPPGVTEAVVAGRRDAPPTGPADPKAQTWSITNTKLEIDGGLHVPAPADGLGWYFSIHSILRDGSSRIAAPTGLQLKARESTPVTANYTVRRTGAIRKTVVIEVTASDAMPDLVVRSKPNKVPGSAEDGKEAGRLSGGNRSARLELPVSSLQLPVGLRVFPATSLPGREFTIVDPPEPTLLITG
ncbi:MAG: hypothetical protein LBV34_27735, partial [Nocardiopsaceae bacterium]|nr:hypothetical protein [Nocardiopsaceae bacterium]